MTLHIYMGFDSKAGSTEGAILIFANTSKEARKVGWRTMQSILDTAWVDMTVKRLRHNLDYLYGDAVQSKLEADIPHAVDSMRDCPNAIYLVNTAVQLMKTAIVVIAENSKIYFSCVCAFK